MAADELERLRAENLLMLGTLTQIAAYTLPDDMDVDDDYQTEWGCDREEAVEMAYENVVWAAQAVLEKLENS